MAVAGHANTPDIQGGHGGSPKLKHICQPSQSRQRFFLWVQNLDGKIRPSTKPWTLNLSILNHNLFPERPGNPPSPACNDHLEHQAEMFEVFRQDS